ncbi:Aminopeptidase 2 mitochondrial [Friedmanniomyces endolithicus]|nr:Aminopeptidase 2 mitochondrial [Friedmanniomyces endolithicus]
MKLAAVTAVHQIDSHTYSADFHDAWTIGNVPHGGFVTACFQQVVRKHFDTTLRKQNQPHTITLHLDFLRRTEIGPATFTVKDVKLGRQTSVIHITLRQDDREEVVGYITNSNLDTETGVSYPSGWAINPAPPSTDVSKLDSDTDHLWGERKAWPFADFRKATQRIRSWFPRAGQHSPAIVDQWLCMRDPEDRFTNDNLGFVADVFPQIIESFLLDGLDSYSVEFEKNNSAEEQKARMAKHSARMWYPTLLLNLDVKKALPAEGVKFLFSRVQAKAIKNGRYDLEVIVKDAEDRNLRRTFPEKEGSNCMRGEGTNCLFELHTFSLSEQYKYMSHPSLLTFAHTSRALRTARLLRPQLSSIHHSSFSSLIARATSTSPSNPVFHRTPTPTKRLPGNIRQQPRFDYTPASKRHCSHRRNMCRQGHEADTSSMDVSHGREVLPKNVKPTHYDLTLEPNLETFKYNGTVTVDLDVKEDTKSISLNTYEIDIQETKITSGENVISSSPKLSYNEDAQATKIDFEQTIPAGSKAKLFLKFTGTLNDSMAGFYRSSYKDANGNEKWMATSQMEPTDARRAFPCFDEPALKAEFTVTLIADHKMTCLSNMDVASEKDVDSQLTGSKRKAVTFNKSPLMSTYLLAFIVGELKVHEDRSCRIPVRVYMTPDKDLDHGKFSAELGARTLEFYEKEFDSEFPLPKMDMVAIPDFSAGAMENWGLITYRVVDLLLDEKTASASTRQRVAEVVQHELAHQWFGNLVTMDFWDGLWLNEGFATWMSWYSCNKFYPEWKVWQGYVTDNLQSALGLDSLRSSHPIEVPVKRADEINQIFDAISYSKGSCVIRMISKHLGEDVFMEGIRRYLKKHAYGNTQTGDLWAALSDASGKDVVSVADTWTKYVGFPVITVEEDAKESAIKVKQNRFLRTADVKPEEDKTIYPVFLGLRTKDGIQEDLTLNKREDTFKVPDMDFYKLNADHSGIYRTNYTPERLRKLGENAKAGLLSVEDRAGMLADAGALTAAGYQKTSGLLSLLKGFDTEPDFVVWDEITARIGAVRAAWIFQDDKVKDALKAFSRDLVSSKAHKLGWEFKESDGHIEQQFKALLFGSAASAGDEKAKTATFNMFDKFVKGDRQAIHPNIRGAVYSVVLQYGGEKEYDAILKEYETAKNADERNTALRSVGRAKDPKLIQRSLAYSLSKEVKDQDIYLPLAGLRAHKEGIEAFWTWMKANWATLKKKLPPSLTMMGSVVAMGTSGFTSEAQRADVEKFFKEVGTKGFERNLAQSLDSIEAKAGWLERDAKDVEEWLKENKYL